MATDAVAKRPARMANDRVGCNLHKPVGLLVVGLGLKLLGVRGVRGLGRLGTSLCGRSAPAEFAGIGAAGGMSSPRSRGHFNGLKS